jgi:hypothetical protein
MKIETIHDFILTTLSSLLLVSVLGLFTLNNSVIRLTEEIKGIKTTTELKIEALNYRLTTLEDSQQ